MSDEKRIDRIERMVEENTKGMAELRLMRAEDRVMMEEPQSMMTEALAKIHSDNAQTREKICRENARIPWIIIAGYAIGGTVAGLIARYLGLG